MNRSLNRRPVRVVALLGLILMAAPWVAHAQFHAPKQIEEIDENNGKKNKHRNRNNSSSSKNNKDKDDEERENPNEGLPTDTGSEDDDSDSKFVEPESPKNKGRDGGAKSDGGLLDGGSLDGGALPNPDGGAVVAPLIYPKATLATLLGSWDARRKALNDHNNKAQSDAETALVAQREELGIRELPTMASALDHEAQKRLEAKDPSEAVRLATLATQLAPEMPGPFLALARVKLSSDVGAFGEGLGALREALVRVGTRVLYRRALLGNMAAAVLAGLFVASILALLALAIRPIRYSLHDFHHLFPRGALPFQTAILFALLLTLPYVLGLGPFVELALLTSVVFVYLGLAERIVASGLLVFLAALPMVAGLAARESLFEGSLAADVARVSEGGVDSQDALARLTKLEKDGKADYAVLFTLGEAAKRQGDYPRALELYRHAQVLSPNSIEVMNNLGNAYFLSQDYELAKEAFLKASEMDASNAVVQYNLYQISTRHAQLGGRDVNEDIDRSRKASIEVYRLNADLMNRPADLRANRFLVDLELPDSAYTSLIDSSPFADAVSTQVRAPLFGSLSEEVALGIGIGWVALLWGLATVSRRFRPSSECTRCGRPVCSRCDKEVAGGTNCGQCHNVFNRKGAVDPPERLRKEAAARLYQDRWARIRRISSYVLAGSGHLLGGHPGRGILFLSVALSMLALSTMGEGVFRAPFGAGTAIVSQVLAALLLVGIWAISVRSYRASEAGK
jgi:tetratricopeptide (TPR) repeat protein